MQQLAFRRRMLVPFNTAFDAYSEIRWRIEKEINAGVFRTRLGLFQRACPCCTYRLDNENDLGYSMLVAMDGNDSLRRVERAIQDESGHRHNIETLDDRERAAFFYLKTETVDKFKDEVRSRRAEV